MSYILIANKNLKSTSRVYLKWLSNVWLLKWAKNKYMLSVVCSNSFRNVQYCHHYTITPHIKTC